MVANLGGAKLLNLAWDSFFCRLPESLPPFKSIMNAHFLPAEQSGGQSAKQVAGRGNQR